MYGKQPTDEEALDPRGLTDTLLAAPGWPNIADASETGTGVGVYGLLAIFSVLNLQTSSLYRLFSGFHQSAIVCDQLLEAFSESLIAAREAQAFTRYMTVWQEWFWSLRSRRRTG